jgi:hypothetical protein
MTELWKANIRLSKAPWESRRRREIPTFPQLRRRVVLLERKRTQKEKTEGRLHKKLDTAVGADLYDSQCSQVSQDVLRIERGRKTKRLSEAGTRCSRDPNHRSGPIIRRRTRYRIAQHGRFRTKDRAAKNKFSDTLLVSCYLRVGSENLMPASSAVFLPYSTFCGQAKRLSASEISSRSAEGALCRRLF